ncbi:hypothetical protein AB0K51_14320 [Kitasatospora sp. NPDC049285]|uniref:hypothetical protein n=1 Tax=Kitasatospora sp. NPDC049285 TaxID=3157096 RepID=UPI003435382F
MTPLSRPALRVCTVLLAAAALPFPGAPRAGAAEHRPVGVTAPHHGHQPHPGLVNGGPVRRSTFPRT